MEKWQIFYLFLVLSSLPIASLASTMTALIYVWTLTILIEAIRFLKKRKKE